MSNGQQRKKCFGSSLGKRDIFVNVLCVFSSCIVLGLNAFRSSFYRCVYIVELQIELLPSTNKEGCSTVPSLLCCPM